MMAEKLCRTAILIVLQLSWCSVAVGVDCQFEGLCAWEWEDTEGFVLVSPANLTSSVGDDERTGPLQDASGSPEGHFLYYGVNSTEGVHHARVVSPWFEKTSGKQCSIEVWLHMSNMIGNTFTIFVKTDDYDWHLLSIPGNNLNQWQKYGQLVGKITQPFRLQMEIEQNIPKVPSHLALDNIRVIDCVKRDRSGADCGKHHFLCSTQLCIDKDQVCDFQKDCLDGEDEEQDCEEIPAEARCNFEEDMCGWTSIAGDSPAEWVLQNGSAVSGDYRRQRPPSTDHTYGNSSGTYILAKFHKKISKMVDSTHLRSPWFPPIPYYHQSVHSAFFNSCQLRVFYHMSGPHMGEMSIFSVEDNPHYADGKRDLLARVFGDQGDSWKKIAVSLPDISKRYFIEFTVTRGARHMELALDDITLSPECFGIGVPENESRLEQNDPTPIMQETSPAPLTLSNRYLFGTCGSLGVVGPTIQQCRKSYANTSVSVSMTKDKRLVGAQFWTVPDTGYYSITARGASGGQGVKNFNLSRGSVVRAAFNLTRGDKITILIGQKGTSACDSVKGGCFTEFRSKRGKLGELNSLVRSPMQPGGGGGGGGATYVFKVQFPSRTYVPLLVAAGGGGMSATSTFDPDSSSLIDPDGKGINSTVDPVNGWSSLKGAGGGGGWNDTSLLPSAGRSLLEGSRGGQVCADARWQTHGGFGGGGGGCSNGGGGGGYRGGDAAEKNHVTLNGQGGSSYISSDGNFIMAEGGQHEGDGSVEILPARDGCGCVYKCVPLRMEPWEFRCICPFRKMLHPDGVSCIEDPTPKPLSPLSTHHLVVIILCILVTVAVIFFFFYLACKCRPLPSHWRKTFKDFNRYRKKQSRDLSHEPLSNPEVQLSRLRQTAGGMVTEYNPNYEFGGSTCTLQDLREIPRENLTLVKALGQGAFGEVYQGYLSNVPGEINDISVAVKTLPEVSSSQAELDFTMEALIMSKFSHINIVRFLGVCFEKMPRFIVLELLPGGDLKSFLRESRPKPNKPSPLSMIDLLNLAIDVAKGCNYLEENHFIHRDIAARNCLLTTKGPGRIVKIADFGMARDIYRADYYRKGGKAMLPVKWMPPEAFLDGVFTSKTDIWSFGVLLWEVMSLGYMPYPGRGNQDVMQLVTSGGRLEPPTNCPSPAYHIMMQCWHPIPEERPSFITILERLGYCLQDPDVVNAPLPVFHRPPSMEKDATVMRPHDSETCLQVQRQDRDLQSPGSEDYLIPMPSSNYSLSTERTELQSASSVDSVDKLLDLEENPPPTANTLIPNGGVAWETSFMGKSGYAPVPTKEPAVDNQNWTPNKVQLGERTSSQQSLDALPIAPDLTQALKANEASRLASLDASALNRQLNNRPLPYVNVDVNSNSRARAANQNTPFAITAGHTADVRHHYPPSGEINC